MHTFLWHDYETFGTDTRRDRPAQFAAIRTDAELNEIGSPVELFCRPGDDYLPDPEACLITGITPQRCRAVGLAETEFATRIEAEMARPATIGVGYNTIRFDDEITRHLFWRNLIDPYAREYKNDCGRWDLIDVVRMTYALRPEGIVWPQVEGKTSFRLEELTRANGIAHAAAHDAVSDVRATIALARLIRTRQPRLFEFALSLHKKERVAQELHLPTTAQTARPFLHVSGMFAPERGCLALMWPLASHPTNRNELLAWDLASDPSVLATLTPDEVRQRLFTRSADLPEGVQRLALKSVHLNQSPMVVGNLNTLTPELAARWGIDLQQAARHGAAARALPDLSALWQQVYRRTPQQEEADVDQDLYAGFVGNDDRRRLARLRALPATELAHARVGFDDARLSELVWRWRMRNFAPARTPEDAARWLEHRRALLIEGQGGALTAQALFDRIDPLMERAHEQGDERAQELLGALYDWAEELSADL